MILKDKVVIISGVGPGMGRKLALLAAGEGARLVVGARAVDFLDKLVAEVKAAGGQAVAQRCDVANPDECKLLAAKAVETYGTINGLVNSAFAYNHANVEDADIEAWKKCADVSVWGALRVAQACIPHMKKAGGGSIVHISTMETRKYRAGEGAYSIAKAASESAVRQMALELGAYNIRVNAAVMGWMWGAPVEGFVNHHAQQTGATVDQVKAGIYAAIPIGRIPPDEECARSVLFFLSDYASVVTGASLNVNGGEFMG